MPPPEVAEPGVAYATPSRQAHAELAAGGGLLAVGGATPSELLNPDEATIRVTI